VKAIPCATCPWRKSSTVGGADIPGFSIDMMRNLACTVGPGDAFRRVMACHGSEEGAEEPCIGYLAVEGYSNLNARLMQVNWLAIDEAIAEMDLWPSFGEMLAAYEEAQ
jgi:hypothetical protein